MKAILNKDGKTKIKTIGELRELNEFWNFKSKTSDSAFAKELINTIKNNSNYSIGRHLTGYSVIFKDKTISLKKKKDSNFMGYPKDSFEIFISQNGERRELDCSQLLKKEIYEFIDNKFKN